MPHFIETLYHNVLSREVRSDDGIEGWTNHARFHGIASTISGFFTCNELQAKNLPHIAIVGKMYRSILGREGRGDEMNVQLDRLRLGHGQIHNIVKDLVRSDEYGQKAQLGVVPSPNMSVYSINIVYLRRGLLHYPHRPIFRWNPADGIPDFVKTLYQNILSRDPENQAVVNHWTNHTRFHGIASTINGFFDAEFSFKIPSREVVVDKLYHSILGREADPGEKSDCLRRLRNGDTVQLIINGIVQSADYRAKAQLGSVTRHIARYVGYLTLDYLSTNSSHFILFTGQYLNGIQLVGYLISSKHYTEIS